MSRFATEDPHVPEPGSRKGSWMQTWTGRAYWPLDPRVEEVHILDIAHALGMLCRYTGHVDRFYSVAEHSWHVSCIVPQCLALVGLLHDATEAYLTDVARPVKRHLSNYKDIELLNWRVVAERFGVPFELPPEIHYADNAMLFAEKNALMKPSPLPGWGMGDDHIPAAAVTIRCWTPEQAKEAFLARFRELCSDS